MPAVVGYRRRVCGRVCSPHVKFFGGAQKPRFSFHAQPKKPDCHVMRVGSRSPGLRIQIAWASGVSRKICENARLASGCPGPMPAAVSMKIVESRMIGRICKNFSRLPEACQIPPYGPMSSLKSATYLKSRQSRIVCRNCSYAAMFDDVIKYCSRSHAKHAS